MNPVMPSKLWEIVEVFLAWVKVLYLQSMVSDLGVIGRDGGVLHEGWS